MYIHMSAVRQQEAVLYIILQLVCLHQTQYIWQAACGESGAEGVCVLILIHSPPLQAEAIHIYIYIYAQPKLITAMQVCITMARHCNTMEYWEFTTFL